MKLKKQDFENLFEKINSAVLKEFKTKIGNFKVRDSLDEFIQSTEFKTLKKNEKITISKEHLLKLIERYSEDNKRQKKTKSERFMGDWIQYYEAMSEYYKRYFDFQNLLFFYYENYPELYEQIIKEYNLRQNREYIKGLGIREENNINETKGFLEKYIPKELLDFNYEGIHNSNRYGFNQSLF